jgi:hypothetical protein
MKLSTYRSATTKCTGKVIRQSIVKLPTVLFVELNTTMALAILTERDFVSAAVSPRCGCETAQVIAPRLLSFSVTPFSSAFTAGDPNIP